jgi:hypothetical protein
MFKHILVNAQASKTVQFLKTILVNHPKRLMIISLMLLGLSACDNTTVSASSGERYVFFVQYTNAAFGQDFRALYINSEGEVIKAEDSVLPELTLDGSYTQQQLDDYYFPNQSIQAQLSAQPMDDLVDASLTVDANAQELVTSSACPDAGVFRYGFYSYNSVDQIYTEILLFETTAEGIQLNTSTGAQTINEALMTFATEANIAFPSVGPCGGYWSYE